MQPEDVQIGGRHLEQAELVQRLVPQGGEDGQVPVCVAHPPLLEEALLDGGLWEVEEVGEDGLELSPVRGQKNGSRLDGQVVQFDYGCS